MFQGGVSTFLAIVSMLCVPSHVVRMFAKTTILVVSFGFMHGLVLLPVMLRTMVMPRQLRKRNLDLVRIRPLNLQYLEESPVLK